MVALMRIPSLFLLAALALSGVAQAERIKDIATIQGVRDNQLVGYGLVGASMVPATRPRRRRSPPRASPTC